MKSQIPICYAFDKAEHVNFSQFVFLVNFKFPIGFSLDIAEMNVLLQMKSNSEKLFHKPNN
jgi:hypothetical protein